MSPGSSAPPNSGDAPSSLSGDPSASYSISANDPGQRWTPAQGMAPDVVDHISRLMEALGELRRTERELSEASRRYMKLNETDMRAIHYLIRCANQETVATPGALARHVGISTASTSKLLDRLQTAGHITRSPHPSDRRAVAIAVTSNTHQAAIETVGRQQAKRIHAAARLTAEERDTVIRFLQDMASEISPHDAPWATASTPGSES